MFFLGRTKRPVANCAACRAAGDGHDGQACACLMCHGHLAATVDPDRICAMRAAAPAGLLAIRTGAVSGLVVIDIDPAHGGRVDLDLMPPTATVRTGGDGWHLYYGHPGQPVTSRPLPGHPGVDVKGDGGYVVAPPAVHPRTGRPYRWVRGGLVEMPPALIAACCPPEPLAPAAPNATTRPTSAGPAGGISSPDRLLAALLDRLRQAPKGTRRATLYGISHGVARMVAAGVISRDDAWAVLTREGRAAGQTEREIRAAIAGGLRDEGVTP